MGFLGLATASDIDRLIRTFGAQMSSISSTLLRLVDQQNDIVTTLERLGAHMATFEEAITDLAAVTDEMADELEEYKRVNAELQEALANGEVARAQALAEQAASHTAAVEAVTTKLRGLGADPENPVPDTTPLPVPEDPATPAEPVTEAPVEPGAEAGDVIDETGDGRL